MLGGEFIIHGHQWNTAVTPTAPKFPGTAGMGDSFRALEEWYALKNFAKDMHVVLVQQTEGMNDPCYQRPPYPETWARMHGKGRVFYSSLGHREDIWTNPEVQNLFLGGIAWILRNVDADVTPNIDKVTPEIREAAAPAAEEAPGGEAGPSIASRAIVPVPAHRKSLRRGSGGFFRAWRAANLQDYSLA